MPRTDEAAAEAGRASTASDHLGIHLVDHVVIGNGDHGSLNERESF